MSNLPVKWKRLPLQEIVKEKEGLRRGPFGSALKKSIFIDDGYKVYQQGNVLLRDFAYGTYFIDKDKFNELQKFAIQPNDFLVTCSGTGTVGTILQVPEDIEPGVMNQALLRIRINPEIIDASFFRHQFESVIIQSGIVDNTQGGAIPNLVGLSTFKKTKFYVPPIEEQRKIAEILGTWDEAIGLTQDLIAAKEERKKGLMQKLLSGKVRFAGADQSFKNSMFGKIPQTWQCLPLGSLGATYNGLTGKSKEYFGSGKKYLPYKNIFDNSKIDIERVEFVQVKEGEKQNAVEYGDIFFTTSSETPNEVGMSSVLLDYLEECYLNSFCFGFRLKDFRVLLPGYARYLFRSQIFRKQIFKLAQGATRYNLSKREVLKIVLLIPPLGQQRRLASFLQDCDREIELLEQKLAALQEQKKGMMQQLLTGQVRVLVEKQIAIQPSLVETTPVLINEPAWQQMMLRMSRIANSTMKKEVAKMERANHIFARKAAKIERLNRIAAREAAKMERLSRIAAREASKVERLSRIATREAAKISRNYKQVTERLVAKLDYSTGNSEEVAAKIENSIKVVVNAIEEWNKIFEQAKQPPAKIQLLHYLNNGEVSKIFIKQFSSDASDNSSWEKIYSLQEQNEELLQEQDEEPIKEGWPVRENENSPLSRMPAVFVEGPLSESEKGESENLLSTDKGDYGIKVLAGESIGV